jgi:hypothetical protein
MCCFCSSSVFFLESRIVPLQTVSSSRRCFQNSEILTIISSMCSPHVQFLFAVLRTGAVVVNEQFGVPENRAAFQCVVPVLVFE